MNKRKYYRILEEVEEKQRLNREFLDRFIINQFWYDNSLFKELKYLIAEDYRKHFETVPTKQEYLAWEMELLEKLFQTTEKENPRFPQIKVTKEKHATNLELNKECENRNHKFKQLESEVLVSLKDFTEILKETNVYNFDICKDRLKELLKGR